MNVIITTNLVCVLFDPAIPTSSFNFIVFYTCIYTRMVGGAHCVHKLEFFVKQCRGISAVE